MKTVGPRMAEVLSALYDRSQTIFTVGDVQEITGLRPELASSLLHKAVKRGLISRLKRGVFVVVPPEMGSTTEYAADPYLVARRLVGDAPAFISHASHLPGAFHLRLETPTSCFILVTNKALLVGKLHIS